MVTCLPRTNLLLPCKQSGYRRLHHCRKKEAVSLNARRHRTIYGTLTYSHTTVMAGNYSLLPPPLPPPGEYLRFHLFFIPFVFILTPPLRPPPIVHDPPFDPSRSCLSKLWRIPPASPGVVALAVTLRTISPERPRYVTEYSCARDRLYEQSVSSNNEGLTVPSVSKSS